MPSAFAEETHNFIVPDGRHGKCAKCGVQSETAICKACRIDLAKVLELSADA
jgi:hypothetical protein